MLYFTRYAENKFETLNKHKVYFTREQIEEAISRPDHSGKKRAYLTARKNGLKIVYKKQADVIKIITFYPVK